MGGMGRAALYSFLLHLGIMLLLCFGLPWYSRPKIEPMQAIPIEIVTIGPETMAPQPAPNPKKAEKPLKEIPAPKPIIKETPPPTAEKKSEPLPERKPEPEPKVEPEPLPEPKTKPEPKVEPESPPIEEKIVEPVLNSPSAAPQEMPPPAPKPASEEFMPKPPVTKPQPPKLAPKKQAAQKNKKEKKQKNSESFESVLKNLDDLIETSQESSEDKPKEKESETSQHVGKVGEELTVSETALLQSHFKQCWSMPAGAEGAEDLSVRVRILANSKGEIQDAEIVEKHLLKNPYYRNAAESALRAAKDPRCAKLPLPLEKYESWKDITLNFNPAHLLG